MNIDKMVAATQKHKGTLLVINAGADLGFAEGRGQPWNCIAEAAVWGHTIGYLILHST